MRGPRCERRRAYGPASGSPSRCRATGRWSLHADATDRLNSANNPPRVKECRKVRGMQPYDLCRTDYAHSRFFSSTLLPRQSKIAATVQENGLIKNPYLITPGFVAAPKRSFNLPINGEPIP